MHLKVKSQALATPERNRFINCAFGTSQSQLAGRLKLNLSILTLPALENHVQMSLWYTKNS